MSLGYVAINFLAVSALRVVGAAWRSAGLVGIVVTAGLSYLTVLLTYRLFFHPLAGIPGPKIAAATGWWEVYENVWRGGHLPFELKELHKIYGPIVRISPNGVHIADAEAYERIYNVGSAFGKDEWYYQVSFGPKTFFTTGDNVVHRAGREPVSQFFSRRSVVGSMQPVVQAEAIRLSTRVQHLNDSKLAVDLHRAFRCFTTDVITIVAWGLDDQLIMQKDFAAKFHDNLASVQQAMWTRLYFPTVTKLLNLTPPKYIGMMNEAVGNFLDVMEKCRQQVIRIKAEIRGDDYSGDTPTVFHALLDAQRSIKRRKEEDLETMTGIGALIYVAAVETTANAMTNITYNVLKRPNILQKVQKELDEAFPDPSEEMGFLKLESLPFLTAVIHEGLRLSFGVASRLPRIVPPAGFQYENHYLPPGVQVGMSSYMMHTDENVFPNPFIFSPERWIGKVKHLDKYLVSFSKGSRQCLGMNLAFCEIYIAIAKLFRQYDMTLVDVDDEDMKITADFFNAYTDNNARKLQVKSTKRD